MSRESLPKWRAPIDTDSLLRYSTRAVKAAERILYDAYNRGDDELALKAATRLTQAVQTHLKALEAAELEERKRPGGSPEASQQRTPRLQLTLSPMSLNRRMNSIEKRLQTPEGGPRLFVGYHEAEELGRPTAAVDTSDATAKDGRCLVDGKWLTAAEVQRRGIRPILVTFPDRVPLPDGAQPLHQTRPSR